MFFTYLTRELRRRMRQAAIISLGLALGVGLVITVTALSSGVRDAQADVLHSLYGQGTSITVTKAPTFGGGGPGTFHFGIPGASGTSRPKAGTTIKIDNLGGATLGTLTTADVTKVSGLPGVAAASGGLTLTDTKTSFTIPNFSQGGGFRGGGGGFRGGTGSGHEPTTFSVSGVPVSGNAAALGPLSAAKLTSGHTLTSADANQDVALLNTDYARSDKLTTGSTVTIAKTKFTVAGLVSQPASENPPDVYIPLARAQALGTSLGASLKGKVNTIYVAATSAANITSVSKRISTALPGTTLTNQNTLASQITGSAASAASLASNLGRWLAIAVLAAAFLLAILLTTAAVSRRVREFGTLKALGWKSRRVVGQVLGESVVIGIVGGILGIALGYAGAAMISTFTSPLSASLGGSSTGSATPGGARQFTGGGFPGGGGGFAGGGAAGGGGGAFGFRRGNLADATHTVLVHLTAPVTLGALVAAVALAIAGGLIAGGFGGWRASRLRPAAALARVE